MCGLICSTTLRPCPLCRSKGPFVPIAFSFESSICSGKPTHVFNPCGHVASKQVSTLPHTALPPKHYYNHMSEYSGMWY